MDLRNYPRREYAIEQFTQARCFELAGERFSFIMDSGSDVVLDVTGRDTCAYSVLGAEPTETAYLCLKADDDTYLFTYELRDSPHRASHTWVIDRAQRLVTLLTCTRGLNPRFPYMVKSEYDFGAIEEEGKELPFVRHCFTGESLGTTVQWQWSTSLVTQHAYLEPGYYRITWPPDSAAVSFETFEDLLPSTDEPARYVKIKDHMFLFVLTEEHMERHATGKSPFRSNNMAFIQNYDRMVHVGRTFGTLRRDGADSDIFILFGAFGSPVTLSEEFLNRKNPFTV
ncbi:MAG: hypothetical protein IKE57_05565 [Oscillospiraceae bacterium]|nr:hypothetical protein [Oscillospiraceae bacterium]